MEIIKNSFFIISILILAIPSVYAQVSIGDEAEQKSVEVTINSSNEIHVKHIVFASNSPKQIQLISGTISNLKVIDVEGNEKEFGFIGDNDSIIIFPSQKNIVVEYNLEDVLFLKNNVWTIDFLYRQTTNFILPEELELIFVNNRPIHLGEKNGISCHGCQMILEYSFNEPKIFKNVKFQDKEFLIEIRTFAEIDRFNFDKFTKSISFHVTGEKQFVTIIVPLQLLPESYNVLVNNEKIYYSNYINNGTHAWINIRTDTTGNVSILDLEYTNQEDSNIQGISKLLGMNQNIIILLGVIVVGAIVIVIIMKKKLSGISKHIENNNTQNIEKI